MLKKANEARAAADAAEKEMKKGEEQYRNIEMQVAKQEKEVDSLRRKAKELEQKAQNAEKAVESHPDNKKVSIMPVKERLPDKKVEDKNDPARSEDCEIRVIKERDDAF